MKVHQPSKVRATIARTPTSLAVGLMVVAMMVAGAFVATVVQQHHYATTSTRTPTTTATTTSKNINNENNNENDNHSLRRRRRRLWKYQFVEHRNQFHTKHERNSPKQDAGFDGKGLVTSSTGGTTGSGLPTVEEVHQRLFHSSYKNQKKNQIRNLQWDPESNTALPHQFLHLHHMKTGGTSTDSLLRCAKERLRRQTQNSYNNNDDDEKKQVEIPYQNLHECSHGRYEMCISGQDESCMNRSNNSAIMSYCAPLSDLKYLGWDDDGTATTTTSNNTDDEQKDNNNNNSDKMKNRIVAPTIDKMTVLRHPVDRVWSMYRFQTRGCYKCRPLLEIYQQIDDPDAFPDENPLDSMCTNQLLNHQVRNLRTNSKETSDNLDTDAVQEAIHNLYTSFTMIGLTNELPTTAKMMGRIWPWLAEEYGGEQCKLPHANASPSNNHCGADGKTHMELDDHPDDETRRVIEEHNALDMELYEAGVAYFDVLKKAMDIHEDEDDYDEDVEKEVEETVKFDLGAVKGALNGNNKNGGGD